MAALLKRLTLAAFAAPSLPLTASGAVAGPDCPPAACRG